MPLLRPLRLSMTFSDFLWQYRYYLKAQQRVSSTFYLRMMQLRAVWLLASINTNPATPSIPNRKSYVDGRCAVP
ncbi:hypothetical protein SprV_0401456100 [Sparganum proliferum]